MEQLQFHPVFYMNGISRRTHAKSTFGYETASGIVKGISQVLPYMCAKPCKHDLIAGVIIALTGSKMFGSSKLYHKYFL